MIPCGTLIALSLSAIGLAILCAIVFARDPSTMGPNETAFDPPGSRDDDATSEAVAFLGAHPADRLPSDATLELFFKRGVADPAIMAIYPKATSDFLRRKRLKLMDPN
jgi:hypothetical protein